ncbi:pentatricopeptide repeat-containing protein-like [Panicum miliaceum]|uniref:Pentatricopeptide repeat-containing protein-like n=1 Tax=Panicum miliaceum TaxID=4540 RepID=A0A3L6PEJ1_PANMI|nr:pentatricopeptide repeat-containing protein-like [Panicum miliaceum]
MPLRLLPPPRRAAAPLLIPTVPHLARLLLSHAPATPPLLLALLPAWPPLLAPLLSHLLLSHSPPLPALSLYRSLLALPHFPVTESSLPVLLRLLARSRRHAHLSFPLLESLPSTHPHLLSTPALAVLLSTALSASAPGASFDAAVTCFDSAARVWARAGRAFGAAELNALLRAFCARGRVAEARALFHRYCDAGVVSEAYRCFREIIEMGMVPTERAFRVLEGFLRRTREYGKVEEIRQMMKVAQLEGHQIEEEAV